VAARQQCVAGIQKHMYLGYCVIGLIESNENWHLSCVGSEKMHVVGPWKRVSG
jgi:hypothetical protein